MLNYLIESRSCVFQPGIDEARTLPLSPRTVAQKTPLRSFRA